MTVAKRVQQVQGNTGYTEWITPDYILEAARQTFGGPPELDPASSDVAQSRVRAGRYYTRARDGLRRTWDADSIWLNPPYDRTIREFVGKLLDERPNYRQALVLTNSATETRWAQALAQQADAVCLLRGRVPFVRQNEDGELYQPRCRSLQGQVVWYLGANPFGFGAAFGRLGVVLVGVAATRLPWEPRDAVTTTPPPIDIALPPR